MRENGETSTMPETELACAVKEMRGHQSAAFEALDKAQSDALKHAAEAVAASHGNFNLKRVHMRSKVWFSKQDVCWRGAAYADVQLTSFGMSEVKLYPDRQ